MAKAPKASLYIHPPDYTTLPIQFPPSRAFPKPTIHHLYLRPHAPKLPTPETPRSLFLVNIPIDSTPTHIRSLFADQLGGYRIERVDFSDDRSTHKKPTGTAAAGNSSTPNSKKRKRQRPTPDEAEASTLAQLDALRPPSTWDRPVHPSGSTAVAVFVDRTSMEQAVKQARRAARAGAAPVVWGKGLTDVNADGQALLPLGAPRYRAHATLARPDAGALAALADEYMVLYGKLEEARARAKARAGLAVDADGFVTVTRGGRIPAVRKEEAERKARELDERRTAVQGFYRFQVREARRAEAEKKGVLDLGGAGAFGAADRTGRRRVEERRRGRR